MVKQSLFGVEVNMLQNISKGARSRDLNSSESSTPATRV